MAAEPEAMAATTTTAANSISTISTKKRKLDQRGRGKKKLKLKPVRKPKKPTQKMIKLYKKRAKAYNSDDDEEEEAEEEKEDEAEEEMEDEKAEEEPIGEACDDGNADGDDQQEYPSSDDEDVMDGSSAHMGVTKFSEGCRAFRTAFLKIMKKQLANDPLGPVLSAHKKLVAEKLLEEETEHKAKGEARKEKHLAGEKGHVKPANYLDSKEKLLITIATKGVVKLFNAVNKAQNPQKGLNPSKSKDAKELVKRRKQTFLSELKKTTTEAPDNSSLFNFSKANKFSNKENDDGPRWAPLRDGYMLTDSKLKDWEKLPEPAAVVDQGTSHSESSTDED